MKDCPATIGPYRVLAELGRGGMGVVYKAHDATQDRVVAIKVLAPDRGDEVDIARMLREAEAARRINHKNVVRVFEVGQLEDGRPYIVMEYIEGQTLRDLIREARVTVRNGALLCAQAADGLAAAHMQGLVHRDVKPSNVIIEASTGQAKIMDFGLARPLGIPTDITHSGMFVGTPHYASPEQFTRPQDLTFATDIWSLGVTLYEAITGRLPFGQSVEETCDVFRLRDEILRNPAEPPSRLNPSIPNEIEQEILRALAKDPHDRHSSASQFAERLRLWADVPTPLGPKAPESVGSGERAAAPPGTPIPVSSPPPGEIESDAHVLQTVENLLAPGGRHKLSPTVQGAQAELIFARRIESARREVNWRTLLAENPSVVEDLARAWLRHAPSGGVVSHHVYDSDPLLFRAAVVAHAPMAIAQMQLVLLDLVRQRLVQGELRVAIWCEWAAVVAVALVDFLMALRDVCALYSVPFPVQSLRLSCGVPNEAAERHNRLFFDAVTQNATAAGYDESVFDVRTIECDWRAGSARSFALSEDFRPTLVILPAGCDDQSGASAWEPHLTDMAAGTVVVVHESRPEHARDLVRWRRDFLQRNGSYRTLGPCGSEFGTDLPESCLACHGPVRRHAVQVTTLWGAFRAAFGQIVQKTGLDPDLPALSVASSYVILQTTPSATAAPFVPLTLQPGDLIDSTFSLRYIGQPASDDALMSGSTEFSGPATEALESASVCPGLVAAERLVIARTPGKILPPLRFGQSFHLGGLCVEACYAGNVSNLPRVVLKLAEEPELPRLLRPSLESTFLPAYSDECRNAVDRIAHRLFGFAQLHKFQHDALAHILTGKDIFLIAATGGGKSECFILPAMLLSGVTIVVSPLKSLMVDQYEQRLCKKYGLGELCTFINGDVPFPEREARLKRLELGHYKLVYLTPEQLERDYVLQSLRRTDDRVGVRYIALDEAHCISQWGHDFRSSYLNIMRRLNYAGVRPVRIALTATASAFVRRDVCDELELRNAPPPEGHVLVVSSNRPELNLVVRTYNQPEQRAAAILNDLKQFVETEKSALPPGAAIVFMPHTGGDPEWRDGYLPRDDQEIGRLNAGVTPFASSVERHLIRPVCIYHSKMDRDEERAADEDDPLAPDRAVAVDDRQQGTVSNVAFTASQSSQPKPLGDLSGRTRLEQQQSFTIDKNNVMVATKGFGMGIDKPNIRLVIHRTPTANLEAYAQEAGRAGRDGEPSTAILYYCPHGALDRWPWGAEREVQSDYAIQNFFIQNRYVNATDVRVMRAFLRTVRCGSGQRLYFTGDEALQFFEECTRNPSRGGLASAYHWPEFEVWEPPPNGYWPEQHVRIRRRGYEYKQKVGYIGRILDVLFRVRPNLPGQTPRLAFLDGVQKAAAAIKDPRAFLQRFDAYGILTSNHYFGGILRAAGLTAATFKQRLEQGCREDLLRLANQLNRSLVETVQILRDIRMAEGRPDEHGRWVSSLLDVQFVTPKRVSGRSVNSPAAWREWAGAWTRTRPERRSESLQDWFPPRVVNQPVGWEVTPGRAFYADPEFEDYLQAFMELHNRRRENDEGAFRRLLTEYIGANGDGTLPSKQPRRVCLRVTLLGYLDTNEVVVGGNCYSCNVCVPEKDLGRYSMEQRRAAVIPIGHAMRHMLQAMEELVADAPLPKEIDDFFAEIEVEEKQERAMAGYALAWTTGLLDRNPGHIAALWIRVSGTARGTFKIESSELIQSARQIFEHTCVAIEEPRGVDGTSGGVAAISSDSLDESKKLARAIDPRDSMLPRAAAKAAHLEHLRGRLERLGQRMRTAISRSMGPSQLRHLGNLLQQLDTEPRASGIDFVRLRAELAERTGQAPLAWSLWERALTLQPRADVAIPIHERLEQMAAPDGSLPEPAAHARHAQEAGWIAPTWRHALDCFSRGVSGKMWTEILALLQAASSRPGWNDRQGAMVQAWLLTRPHDKSGIRAAVVYMLSEDDSFWKHASAGEFEELLSLAERDAFLAVPDGIQRVFALISKAPKNKLRSPVAMLLFIAAAKHGLTLKFEEAASIMDLAFNVDGHSNWQALAHEVRDAEHTQLVASQLMPHYQPSTLSNLEAWLACFPRSIMLRDDGLLALDFLGRCEQVITRHRLDISKLDTPVREEVRGLKDSLLAMPTLAAETRNTWARIIEHSPVEQEAHVQQVIDSATDNEIQDLAEVVFTSDDRSRVESFIHALGKRNRGRVAARLIARFGPRDVETLRTWLNSFSVNAMTEEDGTLGMEILFRVREVVLDKRLDLFNLDYGLLKILRELVAGLLRIPTCAGPADACWQASLPYSPRERLEYLLRCLAEPLRPVEQMETQLRDLLQQHPDFRGLLKVVLKNATDALVCSVLKRVLG